MMRFSNALWLALLAVLALSLPVWAQTTEGAAAGATTPDQKTRDEARAAYGKGKGAFDAGDYAGAYQSFKKAHAFIPTPHTAYWMAACLDKQGKNAAALVAYEAFLSRPDWPKVGEEKVNDAKARRKELRKKLGKEKPAAAPPRTAPPPTPGAPPPAAAPEAEPVDGATYVVRMRDLEQRIDQLKEQIRRSHTRLSLLSETVLSGGVGGARAQIKFTNDMTSAFRLTRVLFVLDGAVQYNKQDTTGKLAAQKQIPIFSGSIPPGDHTLQVLIKLRGHGYGVFSYLRGYKFEVKSAHSFTVTEGKSIELNVIAWEKGGVTTPLEQRPTIRYVEKLRSGAGAARRPASSKKSPGVRSGFSVGTGGK